MVFKDTPSGERRASSRARTPVIPTPARTPLAPYLARKKPWQIFALSPGAEPSASPRTHRRTRRRRRRRVRREAGYVDTGVAHYSSFAA